MLIERATRSAFFTHGTAVCCGRDCSSPCVSSCPRVVLDRREAFAHIRTGMPCRNFEILGEAPAQPAAL